MLTLCPPLVLVESYPVGYPSVAAFVSDDIDGRIYRRFSYLRNRLLLQTQDKIVALERKLEKLDNEDSRLALVGDDEALKRLLSRRYNEKHGPTRVKVLEELEPLLEKYDEMLLREHEISSIKKPSPKQRANFSNFINKGKVCVDGQEPRKHLALAEYESLYRRDDTLILGTQDDAWLGTYVESLKSWMPRLMQTVRCPAVVSRRMRAEQNAHHQYFLATPADRARSKESGIQHYSNERMNTFVKALVCAVTTILLVLPIVILYVLSIHGASGGLKIGILLVFVVVFALILAVITNASRSEMFGASAGYVTPIYCVGPD